MTGAFQQRLSELRKSRQQSQRAAAADLRISQALLSHYETGAREPGLEFISRAAEYYEVSADYLLGRSEERQLSAGFEEVFGELRERIEAEIRSAELALIEKFEKGRPH